MGKSKQGFIIPLVIFIVSAITISGGVYFAVQRTDLIKKQEPEKNIVNSETIFGLSVDDQDLPFSRNENDVVDEISVTPAEEAKLTVSTSIKNTQQNVSSTSIKKIEVEKKVVEYSGYKDCGSVSLNSSGGSTFTDDILKCLGNSIAADCEESVAFSGVDPFVVKGESIDNCTANFVSVDGKKFQCNIKSIIEQGTGETFTSEDLKETFSKSPEDLTSVVLFVVGFYSVGVDSDDYDGCEYIGV